MSKGSVSPAASVLEQDGTVALQYSTTEGYLPLRQFIADRYKKRLGLSISPDEILITNGSQQCLDLIGKVLIGTGDHVAIERPGYLGAIQAFSLYEPVFHPVTLEKEGPDIAMLDNDLPFPSRQDVLWCPELAEPVRDHLFRYRTGGKWPGSWRSTGHCLLRMMHMAN